MLSRKRVTNRKLISLLGSALILGGAAVLGMYWWDLRDAARAQRLAKEWLNRAAIPPVPSPGAAPASRHSIRRGETIGELKIPRLHLSVMIFEGDDPRILKLGAGHIPGTALPPANGNIGIAAHRDTFFRPLRALHLNDSIILRTPAGTSQYVVTQTEVVAPTEIKVLAPAPERDLTLVTCYPFSYIGNAPQRFIVHARKTG